MWKHFLAWSFLVGAWLVACSSDPDPASSPTGDDASAAIDASAEEEEDGSTADGGRRDAGVKRDARPSETGTGDCALLGENDQCLDDKGAPGICCGGSCVSRYDRDHCQTCSVKCDADESCSVVGCVGLTCKPGRTSCRTEAGVTGGCCDGTAACTDLQWNASHCGECGKACAAGQACANGGCVLADCTGAPGGTSCFGDGFFGACCGGACVNTRVESAHCGSCGGACPPGASCVSGQCKDSTGALVVCAAPPSPSTCAAGQVCLQGTSRCGQVACDGPSEEGFICSHASGRGACCGAGCRDLRSDRNHCGACGKVCTANEWCNSGYCEAKVTCGAGNSGVACDLPSDKTGVCCDGTCIDARSKDSCGTCGLGCPTGASCRADGVCVEPDGDTAFCMASSECPSGRFCSAGRCLKATCAPGASGGKCAFGRNQRGTVGTCCDGECVDPTQDKDSCGRCGNKCASGLCAGSLCVPAPRACPVCQAGEQCVEGTCVDPCGTDPFGALCASTAGGLGFCCGSFVSTKCEDIKGDPNNCGGCGVKCPSGQTCQNGVCSGASSSCKDGRQDGFCDLASGEAKLCCGGACVDVTTDTKNCGVCGKSCAADESCIGGACFLTSCAGVTTARRCRVGSASGACCSGGCVDTTTSETHCGQCNKGCGTGAECRASRCAVSTCTASSAGAPCFLAGDAVGRCCGAGSCVDVTKDVNHCLGCGLACAPGQICANGCQ